MLPAPASPAGISPQFLIITFTYRIGAIVANSTDMVPLPVFVSLKSSVNAMLEKLLPSPDKALPLWMAAISMRLSGEMNV